MRVVIVGTDRHGQVVVDILQAQCAAGDDVEIVVGVPAARVGRDVADAR